MKKRLGYIRVSTQDQNYQRQIDSLQSHCDELFIEKVSATNKKRPEFTKVKRKLNTGDTLVVLDLDRAFRSTIEALQTEQSLRKRGIGFEIISMRLDNTTPEGELMFTICSAFCQYERSVLARRTVQGMQSAKARGKHIGRPFKLSERDVRKAKSMLDDGFKLDDVANQFDCAKETILSSIQRVCPT